MRERDLSETVAAEAWLDDIYGGKGKARNSDGSEVLKTLTMSKQVPVSTCRGFLSRGTR